MSRDSCCLALALLYLLEWRVEKPESMIKTFENIASPGLSCRAEFIFDTQTRESSSRPIKVLSECMCDVRRADWESRWNDWSSGRNPYLNLFLCEEHARKLGLMR